MSGGPLLDEDGAVAGINHKGGPSEARDFAVHVKAERLAERDIATPSAVRLKAQVRRRKS
jgi:hypothetical protein